MTVNELIKSDKMFLLAADIAPILGCTAQSIRVQARHDPAKLGFPAVVIGTRLLIPRQKFMDFLGLQDIKPQEEAGPQCV